MLVRLLLMLAPAGLSTLSFAATNNRAPSPLPKGVTLPKL